MKGLLDMNTGIAARLEQLEEKIEKACLRSGRKRHEIKLLGVTKFHPVEAVAEAWNAGMRLFGESRVQEGVEKYKQFWNMRPRTDTELHFIGQLQRNKAKTAAAFFDCIQSVDRMPLIDALGVLTAGRECPLMIMLEYHTGEESKAGFPDLDSLFRAAEKVLGFPGMFPAGLMTMAPFTNDEKAIRASFRKLHAAKDELLKRFGSGGKEWSCLSMGMTSDFEIAIEEGSTMIRLGTSIFGERKE